MKIGLNRNSLLKQLLCVLIIMLLMLSLFSSATNCVVYAQNATDEIPYVVTTSNGEYLFERSDVFVGDNYISKNFKMYEIVSVNSNNKTAVAVFIKDLKRPEINVNPNPSQISATDKKICLYMTHNDESYVPTDGYDSVYGAGGIHDVAKKLKNELELMGISVTLDETLHIPHNSSAYSRSSVTAKGLLKNYSPDALFDIHRDGVSRKFYATEGGGKQRSKIRIVVGQANPNKEQNLEFATYLMSVAEEKYPWLFTDIYFAKGHYNQALTNKALLFEMGTYLIEKELVYASVYPLADVINTALYNTTVNEQTGNITIGGDVSSTQPTVNEYLNTETKTTNNANVSAIILSAIALVLVTWGLGTIYLKYKK